MSAVTDARDPAVQFDERTIVIALAEAAQRCDVLAVESLLAAHRGDEQFWRRTTAVATSVLAAAAGPGDLATWRAQALAMSAGGATPEGGS